MIHAENMPNQTVKQLNHSKTIRRHFNFNTVVIEFLLVFEILSELLSGIY